MSVCLWMYEIEREGTREQAECLAQGHKLHEWRESLANVLLAPWKPKRVFKYRAWSDILCTSPCSPFASLFFPPVVVKSTGDNYSISGRFSQELLGFTMNS